MIEKDILIIGSGIAGLSFALNIAKKRPYLSICILTKSNKAETNTRYAQGGIAVVMDIIHDSYQEHINDTLKAGGGLCNKKVVEMVVKKAPERLRELLEWGVKFDMAQKNKFDAGLEGGHSHARILHRKDTTGNEIEKKLLFHISQFKNISILPHHFALDLITGSTNVNGKNTITCYGAYVFCQQLKCIKIFKAGITMLATGGSGQVFTTTTNPLIATGDGVAMAHRAHAKIRDMQFIQFHPTAFYQLHSKPCFLISEAIRGFGAYMLNEKGARFLFDYDKRGELATRDIISRAIHCELSKSGEACVFLDCRHLDHKEFIKHFPGIYRYCLKKGININNDLIPITPAAHYQCGGITTNRKAQTSIKNLYACGECSSSGLHGSNRLASNSLLEAVVFAHEAANHILKNWDSTRIKLEFTFNDYSLKKASFKKLNAMRKGIRQVVSHYAGIEKSRAGLLNAKALLKKHELLLKWNYPEGTLHTDFWEVKNLLTVAQLIIDQSLKFYYRKHKKTIKQYNER